MRAIKKGDPKKKKSIGVLKSDMNRPKDKPLVGPKPLDKRRVKEIKSKISKLKDQFRANRKLQYAKGQGNKFSRSMHKIANEAHKLNEELVKLTGKGTPGFERNRNK